MNLFSSKFSLFLISLLFLFLSFSIQPILQSLKHIHTPTSSPSSVLDPERTHDSNRPLPRRNYIIRFLDYKKADDHKSYLAQNVRFEGWEWVVRKNPAAKFPTDFGLVAIEDDNRDVLIRNFESLELVKDVSLDMAYHREVLEEKKEGKTETFVAGTKKPGKIFTSMSFDDDEKKQDATANTSNIEINWGRSLLTEKTTPITTIFGAGALWSKGYTGAKVKTAVFDTGIRADHPHFRNIKERTNWTDEDDLNDNIGHGTYVAGIIAGEDHECLGFAPDVEIYAFRVFTDAQVSYTSWFLDAFNYAISSDLDVLNLSIGGPDHLDLPFSEKVSELIASNIIMVSAIGNDGPFYGTLNNPADQSDVIGVGGINETDQMASFSSRGMSTWEIPHGYGRIKPDIVAYGRQIMGPKTTTGCKRLSGTSVSSPVVAGIVCLLVSSIPEDKRKEILNPATLKQALVEGATKLPQPNIYEQGAGRVNLLESYAILKDYAPRASIFPGVLDYTDCPYYWPFCRQPLYAGAMPVIFNATILNGMGVVGYVDSPPTWNPAKEEGDLLSIRFTYSDVIWPWTGFLGLHMEIKEEGAQFSGEIEGNVTVRVSSPSKPGEMNPRISTAVLRLKVSVIPTPPREKRILWDQFHSIKYPPGYIPKDSLDSRNEILDWHGDHLHTNFHVMFNKLKDAGYFIETLGSPLTCFDANHYGTLMLVDLEDEFFDEEITKLSDDVINKGLGLVVFADWYNVDIMVKMRFFDDNTRRWWTPVTGGANVPALNDLLAPFGIAFGDKVLNGDFFLNREEIRFASGANIVKFPGGGHLHCFPFEDIAECGATQNSLLSSTTKYDSPMLGLLEVGEGRIAVYGDSNCLDSGHMGNTNCFNLLKKFLNFTSGNIKDPVLFSNSTEMVMPLYVDSKQLPNRRTDVNFSAYSSVDGKELICSTDSRFEMWETEGYNLQVKERNDPILQTEDTVIDDLDMVLNSTDETTIARAFKSTEKETVDSAVNIDGDVDLPVVVSSHWLIPAIFLIFGFVILLSFWRMWQKRRRRRMRRTASV